MTGTARLLVILAVVAAGLGGLAFLRCEGTPPEVTVEGPVWLGREPVDVAFAARDADSGLRHVAVILETAEGARTLLETHAQTGWLLGTAGDDPGAQTVRIESRGLADGEGTLRVVATDWSWAGFFEGNTSAAEVPVRIDTKPPRVEIESGLTYVQRAGAAAVVYRAEPPLALDGVRVDGVFFPGHPTDEGGERRVAIFAVPRDAPESPEIRVVAADLAGNETRRGWAAELQERQFPTVAVQLPARFFEQKVPELAAELGIDASDVKAAFREINEQVRARNEARIAEVTRAASEARHFTGPFLQMRNSQVTSRFAEERSYRYDGEEISRAVHYGYDLASTARAPVTAANAGRVAFAEDLGIYGLCVIVDHGLGVTSLYGHLSDVAVVVGDRVEKGQVLGTSGATGLAGGDHLHFAILVGGVYVDPLEWWDARWVDERVEARILGAAP